MTWGIILLLFAYVGLKAAQLAFTGRASGYRSEPKSLAHRLKAGEPAILILAALLAVPPALIASWYHAHKFSAVMRQSLDCSGLIAVYRGTPDVMRSSGEHAVYLAYEGYRGTAFDAGWQLGVTPATTQQRLDDAAWSLAAEQSTAGPPIVKRRIAATQRCLHPPREAANS